MGAKSRGNWHMNIAFCKQCGYRIEIIRYGYTCDNCGYVVEPYKEDE